MTISMSDSTKAYAEKLSELCARASDVERILMRLYSTCPVESKAVDDRALTREVDVAVKNVKGEVHVEPKKVGLGLVLEQNLSSVVSHVEFLLKYRIRPLPDSKVDRIVSVTVKDVVNGFGADACGNIVLGDVLLSIDGRPLSGMSLAQVKSLMLGSPGTCCVLDLMRDGGPPFKVEVTRFLNFRDDPTAQGPSRNSDAPSTPQHASLLLSRARDAEKEEPEPERNAFSTHTYALSDPTIQDPVRPLRSYPRVAPPSEVRAARTEVWESDETYTALAGVTTSNYIPTAQDPSRPWHSMSELQLDVEAEETEGCEPEVLQPDDMFSGSICACASPLHSHTGPAQQQEARVTAGWGSEESNGAEERTVESQFEVPRFAKHSSQSSC